MDLAGKGAIVTGGGTGMGKAVALGLAAEGCKVVITGRREAVLEEAASEWKSAPPIQWFACDVSDTDSVDEFFAQASASLGRIDILVNSAGINIRNRSMAETSPEEWEKVLAVNATGAFLCMRAVLPEMRARGEGLVININSIAGKRGSLLGGVAYCASKFAMTALGSCASLEEGEKGIRITSIFPGEVDTPILDNRPQPVSAEHRARILQPEDVAAAVIMIARLPARAHVAELVIKPTTQAYC